MIRSACAAVAGVALSGAALAARAQQPAGGGKSTPCNFESDRLASDSIPGVGQIAFLGGHVIVRCPARGIVLHGDSAQHYPDHDQLIGIAGPATYDEPRLHVTATYLNYFAADERVVAVGDVHGRSANGSTLVGPQAEYRRAVPRIRPREQVNATGRPTITIVQRDSTGKLAPPLTVVAEHVFMDGDSLVYGGGSVVITRPADNLRDTALVASGDSAFIDQGKETMQLMRGPKIVGKRDRPFTLTGTLIDLYSKDRKLSRVIARANAVAVSDSMTLKSDTIDLRVRNDVLEHAYAWSAKAGRATVVSPSQDLVADSLDVSMPGQQIQLVRALRSAFAQGKPDTTRFKIDRPDTTDWLRGDTIVAHFDTAARSPRDTSKAPRIRQLVALGHASSLYHVAPSDTSVRRASLNYVTARDITVAFDSVQKVGTVTTVDSIAGVFVEAKPDTTARRANAASSAKTPPAKAPPRTQPKTPPRTPGKPPVASAEHPGVRRSDAMPGAEP